jgi:DNA polymerase-3 subunit epsilon
MREIVLDTETTGLDPDAGHRVVEVACLELQNHLATGRHFQRYVHPERDMPQEAFEVHGLSAEFLSQFSVFAEVAGEFLEFIGEDRLIIHNAGFDLKFLNAELTRAGCPLLAPERAVDTVALARRRFPGAQVNLDALCRRFEIDNSARSKHGALLDCELLADVYLELSGGRQPGFELAQGAVTEEAAGGDGQRPHRPARPHQPTDDERAAHEAFLTLVSDPIWRKA